MNSTSAPRIFRDRADMAPATFAALYRDAASRIRATGYETYPEYEGTTGLSVGLALAEAAGAWIAANLTDQAVMIPVDLAEELETRLAGVMYALGVVTFRTNISDVPDVVAAWERDNSFNLIRRPTGHPTAEQAIALLESAAVMFDSMK